MEATKVSDKKKLFPKLRFGGYTESWTADQLKNVTGYVDYRGRGPEKSESGIFLVTAKNIKKGFIDYECSKEYVPEANYSEVMSKGTPKIGDILFTTEAPLGNIAQVDNPNIALAQRVIKLRAKASISNEYLLHYMLGPVYQRLITHKAIGSTVLGISGKELHQTHVHFPTLPEQQKIASFLSAVDEKIQQLTRKKELLEQYKKGVMQQLFSGKLRFKDGNGKPYPKWEKKKLGDVISNKSEKHNPQKETLSYKCIELEHLSTNTGMLLGYVDSSSSASIKNKFKKGDVLFGKLRPYLKKYLIAPFDGVCSSEIWVLTGSGIINEFLYRLIQTESFIELTNQSTGSKMPRAEWNVVSSGAMEIPALEEQQKIATYLSAIDSKIESVNQQIAQTQTFKKGLLQQMFV